MIDEPQRPKWQHRKGDEYVVICTSLVGNPEAGFEFVHSVSTKRCGSPAEAQRHGFSLGRSDDFNTGVLRGGELVAVLWMDEVVDDEPSALAERAEAVRAYLP